GLLQLRIAHLAHASPGLAYEPPRSTRSASPVSVDVHSQTLPAMSWRPYGLAPHGCASTGHVVPCLRPEPTAARLLSSSSPHGNRRGSVPRAAFSHSASVGSRPPAQLQTAVASCQSTNVTGWSSGAGQCGGRAAPPSATKPAYCSLVTGVRPSSKASTSTRSCSLSGSRPIA